MVGNSSLFTPHPVFYGRSSGSGSGSGFTMPTKGGDGGFTFAEQIQLRQKQAAAAAPASNLIPILVTVGVIGGVGLVAMTLIRRM